MSLKIQRSHLLKALNHVQSVVQKKNTTPILANVKIEASEGFVKLTTTDMEMAATAKIPAESTGNLSFTISVVMLFDIVKKINGDSVEIEMMFDPQVEGQILLLFNSSKFKLPTLPSEEFPNFEVGETTHKFIINSKILKGLLNKTKHAAAVEETRYYLNGVYLHTVTQGDQTLMRAVATDVHRLAKVDVIMPQGMEDLPGIIIPKKTVMELVKMLDEYNGEVNVGIAPHKIVVEAGDMKLASKLVDGKYPDYARVFPALSETRVELPTQELIRSIEMVISVSNDKTKTVKMELEPSQVIISASSGIHGNASGRQVMAANYNASPIALGFNSRYILESLSAIEGETVRFAVSGEGQAIVAHDVADAGAMYILMPVKV